MLKKVYAVRNNKEDRLYHSNKGITYYQTKGNARNLRKKLRSEAEDMHRLNSYLRWESYFQARKTDRLQPSDKQWS